MKLDICAPQVIFPDDFQSEDPMLVMVDLGRIYLSNSQGNRAGIVLCFYLPATKKLTSDRRQKSSR